MPKRKTIPIREDLHAKLRLLAVRRQATLIATAEMALKIGINALRKTPGRIRST